MKQVLVAVLVLQAVSARPQRNTDPKIVSYENFKGGSGNYRYAYQTTNGIRQEETGQFSSTTSVTTVKGVIAYIAPGNIFFQLHYTADENGYRPYFSIKSLGSDSSVTHVDSNQRQEGEIDLSNKVNTSTIKEERQTAKVTTENQPQVTVTPVAKCNATDSRQNSTFTRNNSTEEGYTSTESPCFEVDEKIGQKAQITILGTGG